MICHAGILNQFIPDAGRAGGLLRYNRVSFRCTHRWNNWLTAKATINRTNPGGSCDRSPWSRDARGPPRIPQASIRPDAREAGRSYGPGRFQGARRSLMIRVQRLLSAEGSVDHAPDQDSLREAGRPLVSAHPTGNLHH